MGLFGKSKQEEMKKETVPQLPPLPKLPDFPGLNEIEGNSMEQIHKLPTFPSSALGRKFSQNTIKEAVSGEEEEKYSEEEDADIEVGMPLRRPMTEEIGGRFSAGGERKIGTEPVFVRIDRFEDAMQMFNETKRKISEIEKTIDEIKRVKEKEDKELQAWEEEVRSMKDQIEKIDFNVFSKV